MRAQNYIVHNISTLFDANSLANKQNFRFWPNRKLKIGQQFFLKSEQSNIYLTKFLSVNVESDFSGI